MQNTESSPAPVLSPPVETPVETLIRETWLAVVSGAPVIPAGHGYTVLGPSEHDVARAIAAALAAAGHLADYEPEPAELTRKIGRRAYRRLTSLKARRRAVSNNIAKSAHPRDVDRAELAALTFAITHIQDTYTEPEPQP